MKKILLFTIFLPVFLYAECVSEWNAKKVAINFLQSSSLSRASFISLDMVYNGIDLGTRSAESFPPFYVFNNSKGKGFVIVSGEDAVMPILGYSTEANFVESNLPPNLIEWMQVLTNQIHAVRTRKIVSSPKVSKAWKSVSNSINLEPVVKYETAQWDQRSPYNDECFMIDGYHAVTGCTATALAIVMYHRRWPDKGVGALPSYEYEVGNNVKLTVPERELKVYNWELMLPVYSSGVTSEQKSAVAQLMADCGVMLQSSYGLYGTGAYMGNVAETIWKYMKYDKDVRFVCRGDFSDIEWHDMIRTDLKRNGPLMYSGFHARSGHAFVLDGYTADGFYSANWGWSGACNGYYLLDAMEPSLGDSEGYNLDQCAILGIRKEENSATFEDIRLVEGYDETKLKFGLELLVSEIKLNIPFDISIDAYRSVGTLHPSSLQLRFAVTDSEGVIKQWIGSAVHSGLMTNQEVYSISRVPCIIKEAVSPGDRIRLFYQSTIDKSWKLIKGADSKGIVWEIPLVYENLFNDPISKCVSLQFDKQTKILQLTLKGKIEVSMSNSSGEDLSPLLLKALDSNVFNIESYNLESGIYILHFKRDDEKFDIKVQF